MNKIYRVIWNASLGAWVAVSEISKSKTKSKSKTVGAVVAVLGAVTFSSGAFAAASTGGSGDGTVISSCIGTGEASAVKTSNIAIGCNSKAWDEGGIALGDSSEAWGTGSIAFGHNAKSAVGTGDTHAIAIGSDSTAYSYSLALGNGAFADQKYTVQDDGALSIGNKAKVDSYKGGIAIGNNAEVKGDNVLHATAIGSKASANFDYSLAIGTNAKTTHANSVALGSDSTTATAATSETMAEHNGLKYEGFAGQAKNGGMQVSIGSGGAERQIKSLAAGNISAASTDAVNGSQLFATNNVLSNLAGSTKGILGGNAALNKNGTLTMTNIGDTGKNTIDEAIKASKTKVVGDKATTNVTYDAATNTYTVSALDQGGGSTGDNTKYYSVNDGGTQGTNYDNDGATGVGALAAGVDASAAGDASTAVGQGANAERDKATAIGTNVQAKGLKSTAIGVDSIADQTESIAIGSAASAIENKAIAMGAKANALGADSIALGTQAKSAGSESIALGRESQSIGNQSISIGSGGSASENSAVAIGALADASAKGALALGNNASASKEKSVALGVDSTTASDATSELSATLDGLEYGAFKGQAKDPGMQVSVGAKGKERQIKNLAAGNVSKDSTDAINGSQLHATNKVLGNVANSTKIILGGDSAVGSDGTLSMSDIGGTGKNNIHDAIESLRQGSGNETHYFSVNDGGNPGDNYNNDGAKGENSLAAGIGALANGDDSIALGGAKVEGNSSIALGNTAQSLGHANIAMGLGAIADSTLLGGYTGSMVVLGNRAQAKSVQSPDGKTNSQIAIGDSSYVEGQAGVGIGLSAEVVGNSSVAIGDAASASANETVALGGSAIANKDFSVALGSNSDTQTDATIEKTATVNGLDFDGFAGEASEAGKQVSIGSVGDERQIKNLAAGKISADSTDAINGSQLYATNNVLGNVASSTKEILGGNAAVGSDGTLSMTDIGGTKKDTIDEAIQASKTEVKQGNNINVTETTDPTTGHSIYTVATSDDITANSLTINNGGPIINELGINMGGNKITNVGPGTDGTDAVNLDQLEQAAAAAKTEVQEGNNINVTETTDPTTGHSIYTVATSDDLTANSLTINNGGPIINELGIHMGGNKITNVGPGTDGTDAVNLDQLEQAAAAAKTEVLEGNNINVTETTDPTTGHSIYTVATSDDITANSLTINNGGPIINELGINMGGNKITNVGPGTDGTDAVNLDQLEQAAAAAKTEVQEGNNINVTETTDPTTGHSIYTVATSDDLTANSLTINNGGPIINDLGINMGGNKITNVGPGTDGTDAVNLDQLEQAAAAAKTEVLEGNNINVTETTDPTTGHSIYTVATSDDITANSLTINNGGPIINELGINMGGNKITNVGPGTDGTDAVNLDQLTDLGTELTNKGLKFAGNDKNTIAKQLGEELSIVGGMTSQDVDAASAENIRTVNNGGELQIQLSKNLKGLESAEVGDIVINGTSNTVEQLSNVDFSAADFAGAGRAATEEQLDLVKKAQEETNDFAVKYDKNNLDGSVNRDSVTFAGSDAVSTQDPSNGRIETTGGTSLNNVASAGDYTDVANASKGVNAGDLNNAVIDVSTELTNKGLKFAGNDKNTIAKQLGEELSIVGGMTSQDVDAASAENIRTVNNGGELQIQLSKNLKGLESVLVEDALGNTTKILPNSTVIKDISGNRTTISSGVVNIKDDHGTTIVKGDGLSIEDGPSFTLNKVDVAGNQIHNVAEGTEGTDAVNLDQLNRVSTDLENKGLNFAGNKGDIHKNLGETLTIKGEGAKPDDRYSAENVRTRFDGNGDLIIELDKDLKADSLALNGKDGITIKGEAGKAGLDGIDGQTRIIYEKPDGTKEEVATLNDGLKFKANSGGTIAKKLNEELSIVGGMKDQTATAASSENIRTIVNDNNELEIQLSTDLRNLNSVTTNNLNVTGETKLGNNFVVNNEGATYKGPITEGDHITNKDYVDGEVGKVADTPLTFAGNQGSTPKKLGETMNIVGAGQNADDRYSAENVRTRVDGNGDLIIELDKDLKADSLALNSKDGKDGITIKGEAGKAGLDGIDGQTRIIYEKPDGTKEEVATLNDGLKFKGDLGGTIAKKLNEELSIVGGMTDKTDTAASSENTRTVVNEKGELEIQLSTNLQNLNSVTTNNLTVTGETKLGNDFVVNNEGATYKGPITEGNHITNKDYVDGKVGEVADTPLTFAGNQGSTPKKLGETMNIVGAGQNADDRYSAENVRTRIDGNGDLLIELDKDLKADSLVLNGKDGKDGITIKGEAGKAGLDGIDGQTRIIYEKPDGSKEEVATLNDGLKFKANSGGTIAKKLNEELAIVGGMTDETATAASNENIRTVVNDDGQLEIQLSTELKNLRSVHVGDTLITHTGLTIKDGPSITTDGISAGNKTIGNVADGVDGKDAVNLDQLNKVGEDLTAKGLSFKGNNGGSIAKKLGDELEIVGGMDEDDEDAASAENIRTVNKNGKLEIQMSKNLTGLESAMVGNVLIDGMNNTITGLSNRSIYIADFGTQGRAATEEQLKEAMNNIDGELSGTVKYDKNPDGTVNKDKVTFEGEQATASKDGNGNITTEGGTSLDNVASAGDYTNVDNASKGVNAGDLNNAVNDAVSKAGDNLAGIIGGDTTVNADGSVSNKNIGNTGKDNIHDAIDSINQGVAQAKTSVSAGDNITVTESKNADGSSNYTVATKKDVTFDSVTSGKVNADEVNVGDIVINKDGINAGNTNITNVKDGAVNADSKDAVNGSQLNNTNEKVTEFLGGGAKFENGTWTGPSYTVGHGDGAQDYNNVGGAIDALNKADKELGDRITNLGDRVDQGLTQVNKRIGDVEKAANAGIAAAMALESAPFVAGKFTYAAGAAYHGGENAIGVTLRRTADSGRWSITGGVAAASEGDPSVRIGISGVID